MNCTCVTDDQVWAYKDPTCPVHGGYPPYPQLPVIPTATNTEPEPILDEQVMDIEEWKASQGLTPKPGEYLTVDQMQKWLTGLVDSQQAAIGMLGEQLKGKLPPDTYLAYGDQAPTQVQLVQQQLLAKGLIPPVDMGVMPPVEEDPATAPCRVYWNFHGCDKPRIHVLPGHPAGPEHVCEADNVAGPCSKVTEDGNRYDWSEMAGEWEWVATVKPFGEDWPVPT